MLLGYRYTTVIALEMLYLLGYRHTTVITLEMLYLLGYRHITIITLEMLYLLGYRHTTVITLEMLYLLLGYRHTTVLTMLYLLNYRHTTGGTPTAARLVTHQLGDVELQRRVIAGLDVPQMHGEVDVGPHVVLVTHVPVKTLHTQKSAKVTATAGGSTMRGRLVKRKANTWTLWTSCGHRTFKRKVNA